MPYHIYIPWLQTNYLSKITNPKILEIGVDVGQTLLPLFQNFTIQNIPFEYTGIDIRKDENLLGILSNFIRSEHHIVKYEIANSLEWLPKCENKFDIIFIDGDHNYKTVYEELKHVPRLLNHGGIVVCDDYQNSKWSMRDLYYSTRESHSNCIDIATKYEQTEKVGVKAAIDDFINENPGWKIETPILISEAVLIQKQL
jgi:predicted O-methyltransferase YrrM